MWLWTLIGFLFSIGVVYSSETNYVVRFSNTDQITPNLIPLNEIYQVGDYHCIIPPPPESTNEDSPIMDAIQLESLRNDAIESIKQFNSHWHDKIKSIRLHSGYWDYIFGFNEGLHQAHFEPIKIDQNEIKGNNLPIPRGMSLAAIYTLFRLQDTNIVDSDFELISLDSGLKYVTQNIGGGDVCDLTGRERSTTVQYKCNPKANKPLLIDVQEWRTCEYIATIESDWFCSNSNSNSTTAWSEHISNVELEINCILNNTPIEEEEDGEEEWVYSPPLDLTKYFIYPLKSGVFLGLSKKKSDVDVLILAKDFQLSNISWESDDASIPQWDSFLNLIGLGFQKLIRSRIFLDPSSISPVTENDLIQYTLPLYSMNRSMIGSVFIEQKNGDLITYLSNDLEFDYDMGNWIFHSFGNVNNEKV